MIHRLLPGLFVLASLNAGATCPNPATLDDLRAAFGGARLNAVGSFDYRLTITEGTRPPRSAHYRLQPAAGRLRVERDADIRWWDGAQAWRGSGGDLAMLADAAAAPLRAALAYHFVHLLADPATQAVTAGPQRLRVTPRTEAPFVVGLDPQDCSVTTLAFDDGTTGVETDYRDVDGLRWPFRFTVSDPAGNTREGEFSEVAVRPAGQDFGPAHPRPETKTLPDPAPDAATLAGPTWLSTAANDYNLSLDAAQALMVFARSEAKFAHSKVWWARRSGGAWSNPEPIPFSDARYRDSDPWITPDGQWMYFVSDRPPAGEGPPKKDLDIWRVRLAPTLGRPEHLAGINSEAYELGPELHGGWLYFNSARQGGPATLSIWRARVHDGGFGAPEPLPAPFNAGRQQGDFTLSPDGRLALFWQAGSDNDGELHAARRTADGWSCPVRLPAPFNGPGFDFTPAFTPDGERVLFASERQFKGQKTALLNGLANLYVAPRRLVDAALDDAERRQPLNPSIPAAPSCSRGRWLD